MHVLVIRTSGAEEAHEVPRGSLKHIRALIGAQTLDTVNLRDGRVMLVDDDGYEVEAIEHAPGHIEMRPIAARKAVNPKATALYHGVCRPGTTHQIVGDVAIARDADFAGA